MAEFRRLTYKTPDGAWGIEGVSLLTCPARLYGAAAKLCDMETLCEDVYRAKDAELTLDALQEPLQKFFAARAAGDHVHAQRGDVLGVELRIAAAHAQHGLRMFAAQTADERAVFAVGHGGDGTGVDNDGVAVRTLGTQRVT